MTPALSVCPSATSYACIYTLRFDRLVHLHTAALHCYFAFLLILFFGITPSVGGAFYLEHAGYDSSALLLAMSYIHNPSVGTDG